MPLFHLIALDKPDSLDLRMANRPDHLAWAGEAMASIRMAGPVFADDGETFAGSVFILEMDSVDAVKAWHANDPYVKAGLFQSVDIRPCKWLIGDGKVG